MHDILIILFDNLNTYRILHILQEQLHVYLYFDCTQLSTFLDVIFDQNQFQKLRPQNKLPLPALTEHRVMDCIGAPPCPKTVMALESSGSFFVRTVTLAPKFIWVTAKVTDQWIPAAIKEDVIDCAHAKRSSGFHWIWST